MILFRKNFLKQVNDTLMALIACWFPWTLIYVRMCARAAKGIDGNILYDFLAVNCCCKLILKNVSNRINK